MIELTKEELLSILEAFEWVEDGLNCNLYNKIHDAVYPPKTCKECGSREEYWQPLGDEEC
jgi:hypothetical protein